MSPDGVSSSLNRFNVYNNVSICYSMHLVDAVLFTEMVF